MTTLHGSAPSLWRRAEGCVPPEGTIASARDLLKSTHFLLGPPWPYRMSLDPLIRIPSSHVGASESLQSHFSHHLDLVFSLSGFHLRVLRDWYELSIGWITFRHVTLDYVFHSMSLSCFLPRAFVLISWLNTPFHFVVSCWMLRDMFIDHLFTLYTCHDLNTILCLILDLIFDSMLIFSLQKSERHIFAFTFFSRELPWSPYYFSLMELELKVESMICGFSHLFHLGLLIGII